MNFSTNGMARYSEDEVKEVLKQHYKEKYEKNKEKIRQKSLEYYHANKDKINKKVTCKCGGTYIVRNKDQHIETKMHKGYLRGLKENLKKIKELKESSEESSDSSDTSDESDGD